MKALPFKKEIVYKGGLDKAEEHAARTLAARRYRVSRFRAPGTIQLMTQKGAYSRLGYIITHVSILLVFVGALTFFPAAALGPIAEHLQFMR